MQKTLLRIKGMTCSSCEVRIERKWKGFPGVKEVHVNHHDGTAVIISENDLNLGSLQAAVANEGYRVCKLGSEEADLPHEAYQNDLFDYINVGGIFVILMVLYLIFKELGFAPGSFGVSENMSYGFIFVIGLVAAFSSCMAVTGGLLLAVSSEWAEQHPELSGWQKFKPLLWFNAGRLFFYAILGGLVGAVGSALKLTPFANAVIVILAGIVMLMLGIHLLHLFPWASRLIPRMPKFLAHKIHDYERHEHPLTPALLGGATFFLPCGFTQALQLYALSTGSWRIGALTMFVFALGTLPALLSVSALSSFLQGAIKRTFLRVAGALIILIALLNIKSGLVLSGLDVKAWFPGEANAAANVELVDGKQIARMKITGLSYSPTGFTVKKGIPVEWQVDGQEAAGCGRFLVMPQLRIQEPLKADGITTIAFTPSRAGRLYFSCPMGMTSPWAAFEVID